MISFPDTMNRFIKHNCLFFLMIYCLMSCNTSEEEDHYNFKDLLSIAAEYNTQIVELEKKADECVDFAEAYKYAAMAKNLKKEGDNEIRRIFDLLPKPVVIPVNSTTPYQFFSLSGIEIISADLSALSMHARVNITNPGCNHFIEINLCGIDESRAEMLPRFSLSGVVNLKNKQEILVSGQLRNPEQLTGLLNFKVVSINTSDNHTIPGSK